MNDERYYVPVDRDGVEHNATGDVHWFLPSSSPAENVSGDGVLELRRPIALLEVLDEQIYEAEPLEADKPDARGVLAVRRARLTRMTEWDTEHAARFAIDSAAHVLGPDGDVPLPDGTSIANVLGEARAYLEAVTDSQADHLGAIARLFALHRLRKERRELGDMAFELASEELSKGVDALDDPSYEALEPLIDAVLAAISALRHHALLRLGEGEEDRIEHKLLDREKPIRIPASVVTPWGAVEVGGTFTPRYGPAWLEARDAARHARRLAFANGGAKAEAREREWQADALSPILQRSPSEKARSERSR